MNPFLPESVQRRLVLASQSPRRRELLAGLGFDFAVEGSRYRESNNADEDPAEAVQRHALGKAREVARRRRGDLVIGADTVVMTETLMGKPVGAEKAREMLRRLSGREHEVMTAVALVEAGSDGRVLRERVALSRTQVRFRELSADEIEAYLAGGEPFDKAGAYGIQGHAAQFVTGITGCYFNVMGLPLELLTRMLRDWAGPVPGEGGDV